MQKTQADAEGAVGLFSDKYGDVVRVVKVGDVSSELCGGTHATSTLDCFPFVILSESSVSAGIRRIEAVSGRAAVDHLQHGWEALRQITGSVKVNPADSVKAVQRMEADIAAQRDTIKQLRKQLVGKKEWKAVPVAFHSSRGVESVVVHAVPAGDAAGGSGELKADALALAQRGEAGAHVLLCAENGVCVVSGMAPVVEEVWRRLMKGLVGTGGKGGGSGGLMQGRLPYSEEGGVEVADVFRLLSATNADTPSLTSVTASASPTFPTQHARAGS